MINAQDIDFMHASLDEIYTNRERNISVIYVGKKYDPITGVPIGEGEVPREVSAVVTEISSGVERSLEGGVKFEEGDIKVDVKIELIEDIAEVIERMEYDGDTYEILSIDKKGIGRRNRYEIVGRVIA